MTEEATHKRKELIALVGAEVGGRLAVLERFAPWLVDHYRSLRADVTKARDEGGAIPSRYRELIIIAIDVLHSNPAGVRVHAAKALQEGATVEEIVELLGILLLTSGIVPVQAAGVEALRVVEETLTGEPASD